MISRKFNACCFVPVLRLVWYAARSFFFVRWFPRARFSRLSRCIFLCAAGAAAGAAGAAAGAAGAAAGAAGAAADAAGAAAGEDYFSKPFLVVSSQIST